MQFLFLASGMVRSGVGRECVGRRRLRESEDVCVCVCLDQMKVFVECGPLFCFRCAGKEGEEREGVRVRGGGQAGRSVGEEGCLCMCLCVGLCVCGGEGGQAGRSVVEEGCLCMCLCVGLCVCGGGGGGASW